MTSSSRLELIISSSQAEQSLKRLEGRLNSADRAGESISTSMTTVERRLAGVERFARAASGAFLGLSAGAGVFTAIARSASQSAAEIDNLSRLANTNVEDFQRLSFASRAYGVEQDKLADILKDTNDRVGDFLSTGGGEMKDFFEQIAPQIGVTAEEFRNLSGPQALQKYYDGLQAANLSQAEMTFYMESVADEATALIPLLRDGGAEMDRLGQEADDLNAILSQMEIQRLKDIRGEFGQLGQQLSTETMRAISQFDDLMKSSLEGISYGINNVARGFNVFMDSFRDGEAKRSIAGIDAELNALFDTKARLEQRIDMFGADSPQAQDTIAALSELRGEYIALIDRKKELQQAGLPVTEPEIVQLDRASTEIDKLTQAQKKAIREAEEHTDALNGLLNAVDPVRAAHQDYAERLESLNRGLSEGSITTQEYGEALRWAAGEYTDLASGADDAKKALGQLTQQYDSQYQRGVTLTTAIEDINAAYRRGDIDGQQYGRMIQGVRDEMAELALEADPMAQEMARAWEEATNRIDETFSDAFAGAFNSFDSFADQLLDGFKRLLSELAYQATLKPIVVAFTGDMQSMMGIGGQSGGGFSNTIGAAKNLWSSGSSLLSGGSSAAAAGGLYSGANTGLAAGGLYGNAVTGGLANTGLASSITSGISAAMPWLAGGMLIDNVLGLGITESITKALGGLFGSEKKPEFRYQQDGRAPETYDFGGRESAFGTFGFEQQRLGEDGRAALDEFSSALQQADNALSQYMTDGQISAASAALDEFAYSGLSNADLLADRLDVLLNASGMQGELYDRMRDELQGADAAERYEAALNITALESVLTSVPDSVIAHVESRLASSDAAIGKLTQSLSIQIQQWEQLGGTIERFVPAFDRLSMGAVDVTNALHDAAGGMENLSALHSSYYQAFFTDAERAADLQDDLTQSLRAMGMELPATRDGFRSLVEAQDISSQAGRDNYLALLQLSGGFDQLKQMIGSVDEVVVDMTADLSGVESAWKRFSKAIDAERDILKSAHDQTTASIRGNMSTIQDAMRTTERAAGSLQSTLDQMMGNSVIDQRGRFDAASSYLSQTLNSGGLGDPGQLERALAVVSQPSEGMYSTLQDYQRDFLSTANIIDQLNDRADEQLTTEERSLRALERQVEQADRQFEREMSALDASLATEQAALEAQFGQLDWLSTLNDSVLSITDALGALDSAASQASGGATSSAINRAYKDILGRDADDSGLAYYGGAGFSLSEIRARLRDSDEAHGSHANGLSNVPFDGYRAVLHKGEDVIPAPIAQMYRQGAPSGGSNAELVAEVRALRSELRESQRSIAEYTRQSARTLERGELRQEGIGEW